MANPNFFAFLDLGGGELLVILVIVLLLFGGKRMPEIARGMGKAVRELKKATGSVEEEFKKAMDEVELKKMLEDPPRKKIEAPKPAPSKPDEPAP